MKRIKLKKITSKIFYICPKTGKVKGLKNKGKWVLILLPIAGFVALLWFLIRVIPKPSRAAYPCQQVAAPLAFGFIIWLVGLIVSGISFIKTRFFLKHVKLIAIGVYTILMLIVFLIPLNLTSSNILFAYEPFTGPNSPVGTAKGVNPGRVTWIRDTQATSFDGSGFWWDDNNTDQVVVDEMMSKTIRWLAGKPTDQEAWDALFRYFNQTKHGTDTSYTPGEKIVIKVNMNQDFNMQWVDHHMPSPHVVHALVDQLINTVGVNGGDITIAEACRNIGDPLYNKIHQDPDPEFREVNFVAKNRTPPVADMSHPIYFSGDGIPQAGVPTAYTGAKYIINMALFRPHTGFGITACGKNNFGSVYFEGFGFSPVPMHISEWSAYGDYHSIVDLIGHDELGGKTILYIVDALYHASDQDDTTIDRFASFGNDWASSIFASQDPVAIDSVVLDFLSIESSISIEGYSGCPDNYLIEAALAHDPPSNTLYDPNNTGGLDSLGVHEHWNNPSEKKYSRNLGTGDGIELYSPYTVFICAGTGAGDFITRLYELCLERGPDEQGLNYWACDLISGDFTAEDAGYGFVMSQEYIDRATTNTEFVEMLYNVFLDRIPDDAGLDFWVGQLETMATRPGVLNGFIHSTEFEGICSSYGITAYTPGIPGFVTRFYTLALERMSDFEGLDYWSGQLETGVQTGEDVAYGFIFSDEFLSYDHPDSTYVSILYNAFFDRVPDTEGYIYWMALLGAGYSREYVLDSFIHSTEFESICDSYGIVPY